MKNNLDICMYSLFFIAVLIFIAAAVYLYRAHKTRTAYYNDFIENKKKSFVKRNLK